MEGLLRNYWMNMKRICRLMPVIITGTVLLCLCVLLGAYVFTRNNASDHTRIKIGVVGNIDNSYLEYGITALQSMDTTRYIVELVTVNEDEAAAMIRAGELTAYMVIPEGFVDSVMYGRNNVQVEYVCGEGDAGLLGSVMEEIVDSYSEYVTGSQSAIYAAESINKSVNGHRHLSEKQLIDINTRCINSVLNREKLCELRFLGAGYNLSVAAYYFCGIFVVFLLLSGINSCMYFTGRSREFQRISVARGLKIWQQLLGEYIPFFIISICTTLCVWLFLTFAFVGKLLYIDEWADNAVFELWKMLIYIIPLVVFVTIIQMLIYELADNLIGSILLQFIISICMGYVSGCFYPEQYFPETIRNISNVLPTKMAARYMASYFTGDVNLINNIGILVYSVTTVTLIYMIRRYRIRQS